MLPIHERFQRNLLLGKPEARRWWKEIRSYIDFYSWNLPNRYRPLANIAIVAADPMASFEVMNLLARHNLPFEIIAPERLRAPCLAVAQTMTPARRRAQPDAVQRGDRAESAARRSGRRPGGIREERRPRDRTAEPASQTRTRSRSRYVGSSAASSASSISGTGLPCSPLPIKNLTDDRCW